MVHPQRGGKVFFFCVAGQNRSATLAIAVQILQGKALQEVLTLAVSHPGVLGWMMVDVVLDGWRLRPMKNRSPVTVT